MPKISNLERRAFIQGTLAAAATAVVPANGGETNGDDRIRIGMIGVGGRGLSLMQGFIERGDCSIMGICDPHGERLAKAAALAELHQRSLPPTTTDVHELLANKDIDAVVIATPDHWHCPATVYACRAGKHVYVEKPLSRCAWEGRQAIAAARKYDRVVQVGTQNRSAPYNFKARDY
ncbi:MAG: Gfo/Idh/MocA family protein, partial [Aeoliella sp.]